MREPREIRRDPDERPTESARAGPADRGDYGDGGRSRYQVREEHHERFDDHGKKAGTTDIKFEKFEDGKKMDTVIEKDTRGHETMRKVDVESADGHTEYHKFRYEDHGKTFETVEGRLPDGGWNKHQETYDSSGHTISSRDEKSWTDAEGNTRRDVTEDNQAAKKGEVSHRETHEVIYNKDSPDGKHKAGDRESSTLEIVKH
jgi:hypothetical protein